MVRYPPFPFFFFFLLHIFTHHRRITDYMLVFFPQYMIFKSAGEQIFPVFYFIILHFFLPLLAHFLLFNKLQI
jgi:hypothetical protein